MYAVQQNGKIIILCQLDTLYLKMLGSSQQVLMHALVLNELKGSKCTH